MNAKRMDTIKDQKWQGKLIQTRWIDKDLVDCFSCLYRWQLAPTNTIAGLFELYQQLVPTKLYNQSKTRTENHKRCDVPNVPRMPRKYSTCNRWM